jgi:hypothetical protein
VTEWHSANSLPPVCSIRNRRTFGSMISPATAVWTALYVLSAYKWEAANEMREFARSLHARTARWPL